MSDSTISDSVRSAAQDRLKELTLAKAKQYPGFQHLKDQYDIQGDSINWIQLTKQVPGLDTLSDLFDSNPEELFQYAEKMAADKLTQAGNLGILSEQMNDAEALTKLPDQYMDQYAKYTDKEYLQEQAKMKAVEEAVDHFAEHADQLQAAQQKVSKLLSKYKEFSNSSDLSTAVKRTSLKGSTLWERLVVGGNFNVISTDPLSVDLSPQLGYKFTTRFNVGISASYRYTHNDTIRHGWYVSPSNTAIKMFSNYDIIRNFFVTAEWELSGVKAVKNDLVQKDWISNYFVGAGKKLLIHPKVYMTITALYNLNNKDFNSAYPRRFQVKIGFQLSELAMRKKKIYYDPNR